MLKDHELTKLRGKAKYDENNNKWVLPAFFIKEKEVHLPKIKNSSALVQNELDKRDIVFDDEQPSSHRPAASSRKSHHRGNGNNDNPYGENYKGNRQTMQTIPSFDNNNRYTPSDQ